MGNRIEILYMSSQVPRPKTEHLPSDALAINPLDWERMLTHAHAVTECGLIATATTVEAPVEEPTQPSTDLV